MNLSTEVKEARAALGLSQSEAAKAWGIPLPTLKAYEKQKRTPRGLAMTKLREILSVAMAAKPTSAPSARPVLPDEATPKPPPKAKRRRRRHKRPGTTTGRA